ncbi:hypothetical protein C8Q76DRAFT_794594 [Earliella scabrosa]|nr:hypothetical protein C8Q76DRAFT_794594 [Earliella scabrosa]
MAEAAPHTTAEAAPSTVRMDSPAFAAALAEEGVPRYLLLHREEWNYFVPGGLRTAMYPDPTTAIWLCPFPGCMYVIDLNNVTEENLATSRLSNETKERLRRGEGHPGDDWVRAAFDGMRNSHCFRHLFRMGIRCCHPLGELRLFWKTPELAIRRRRALGWPAQVPDEIVEAFDRAAAREGQDTTAA